MVDSMIGGMDSLFDKKYRGWRRYCTSNRIGSRTNEGTNTRSLVQQAVGEDERSLPGFAKAATKNRNIAWLKALGPVRHGRAASICPNGLASPQLLSRAWRTYTL